MVLYLWFTVEYIYIYIYYIGSVLLDRERSHIALNCNWGLKKYINLVDLRIHLARILKCQLILLTDRI